ncbi:MAG TPA: hypothetical protein VHV78_04225, partial [Gemmatimonadaceae bacterium]|nr:hypothetical protein [Gemmatimonadaceae bacterium]
MSALENSYEIVGELRGVDDLHAYLARRRTSAVDVMITVVPAAAAGENNALSLFAADVSLLSGVSHSGVLEVFEGRWLTDGSYAEVTSRPRGVTLGERLASSEQLENHQIASLLRDVNATLRWARGIGVVHRGVSVDAMYVEPGTGRVEIALLPTPIAAGGIPGEATDARTLGDLAWTMFAGFDPDADVRGESLSSV